MNRPIIVLLAFFFAGCFAPHAFESHDDARARSARDGSAVIGLDTLFYKGRAVYLVHSTDALRGMAELHTFSGTLLAKVGPLYTAPDDSIDYAIELPTVSGRLMVRAVDEDPALGALIAGGVLVDDHVDPAAVKRYSSAKPGIIHSYEAAKHIRDSINAVSAAHEAARARDAASSGNPGSGAVNCTAQLHNKGSNTVRVFIGEKPGYSSGSFDRIGGNTWGMSIQCGQMIWIVDDHDNAVVGTKVASGSRYVVIGEDGRSIWTE